MTHFYQCHIGGLLVEMIKINQRGVCGLVFLRSVAVAFSKPHGGFNGSFSPPYFFNFHFANIFGDDVLLEIPKKNTLTVGPKNRAKGMG